MAQAWTEVNDLNTVRYDLGGTGATNTAALAIGGNTPTGFLANTESWNGTSWTEVNDLTNARGLMAGAGTTTAALSIGGEPSPARVISWNGTSWANENDLNIGRII
jgi:hypothetical protein